ncbi:MAG TPA: NUDIX domain-containing protein [Solirubrobacteraceae bacterium]|nr:NUDIX domain-containing protein [Solirubrobacteraceae bacterium]
MTQALERSAGGVVVRGEEIVVVVPVKRAADGRRVLGLPKGHPELGESDERAALREVREEAGVAAEIVGLIGETRYEYERKGRRRDKSVVFFLMRYLSGDPADHDHEMEDAGWMPIEQAIDRLTYEGERDIVRRARALVAGGDDL